MVRQFGKVVCSKYSMKGSWYSARSMKKYRTSEDVGSKADSESNCKRKSDDGFDHNRGPGGRAGSFPTVHKIK